MKDVTLIYEAEIKYNLIILLLIKTKWKTVDVLLLHLLKKCNTKKMEKDIKK